MTSFKTFIRYAYNAIYLICQSIYLFFLLPLCFFSKRILNLAWSKFYMRPLEKNVFNLCVQWLLYVGNHIGMSYEQLNVLIFCIIWPIVTILSIILNLILLLN